MAKLYINITIDWEGDDLSAVNDLNIMRKRLKYPVSFTHFICPAYFTNTLKNARKRILSAIEPHDEIALHFHSFRSLVEYAGVAFHETPNFYRTNAGILPYKWRKHLPQALCKLLTFPVNGRGVPLSVYPATDIQKLIQTAHDLLLESLQIKTIQGFRAGGWMASDTVLQALQQAGFAYDSSAAPPGILSQGYSPESKGNGCDEHGDKMDVFTELVEKIWGFYPHTSHEVSNRIIRQNNPENSITKYSQPFAIQNIIEMPNNGGMTDFVSLQRTFRPLVEHGIKQAQQHSNFYLNTGCHQEGDFFYKTLLIQAVNSITPEEKQWIEFSTVNKTVPVFCSANNP